MATVVDKYQFAQELVKDAGEFLRQHIHDELRVEMKSNFSDLVTHLDKEVQAQMTEKILSSFAEDLIFGEEDENRAPIDQGNVWVLDPIDGTVNFIVQKTDFAILLAYFEDGVGQFGLIYDVMNDVLYHGGRDFPVKANEEMLPECVEKEFSQGLIGINAGLFEQNYAGLADFSRQFLGTRSIGSAGLSFAHVLNQRLLVHTSYVYPWDYAAAGILGEKLGYRLLNVNGQKPTYTGREHVILIPQSKVNEMKRYLK
ncbi:inositol monophosphatase family protein [Streptococcus gallolyticus]|uniref:inositol monophosphatase family protein n=1 Tax=Streptococcus hepaticus TaxID=3349163 RepID=UPI001C9774B6|nr:inositol monophosphatase family protein [Streptococcus gallolyticus]MBY5041355.1 inositol monophosphatase family protein [Streptococcus gallolyticus]